MAACGVTETQIQTQTVSKRLLLRVSRVAADGRRRSRWWQLLLLGMFAVGGFSGCSDAQNTDTGLPSDPVARELMERKAEEAGRAFVSAAEVPVDPQRTAAANGAAVVASLHSESVPSAAAAAGLPDSFRLMERSAADASAQAAHAAADAVGVPDVPQNRLLADSSEQVTDRLPAAAETGSSATPQSQSGEEEVTAGGGEASGAEPSAESVPGGTGSASGEEVSETTGEVAESGLTGVTVQPEAPPASSAAALPEPGADESQPDSDSRNPSH